MNTGQTLITMGALILITITILNFHRNMADIDDALNYNRFRLEGLSVLTSHIEMASQYFFDEASTDVTNATTLNDFSTSNALGWDSGDNGLIDDIDDLHTTTISDTGESGVIYSVLYTIDYVTLSGTNIVHSNNRTYHKRINIDVFDSFTPPLLSRMENGISIRDSLNMNFVVSFWQFN
jgi:hypothetical protein